MSDEDLDLLAGDIRAQHQRFRTVSGWYDQMVEREAAAAQRQLPEFPGDPIPGEGTEEEQREWSGRLQERSRRRSAGRAAVEAVAGEDEEAGGVTKTDLDQFHWYQRSALSVVGGVLDALDAGAALLPLVGIGDDEPAPYRVEHEPVIPELDGAGQALVRGAAQFMTVFVPGVGAYRALGLAGKGVAGAMTEGTVVGALADFVGFKGDEANVSEALREAGVTDDEFTAWLAAKPEGDSIEGRLKTAVEGALLGNMLEGVVRGGRWVFQKTADVDAVKRTADVVMRAMRAARDFDIAAGSGGGPSGSASAQRGSFDPRPIVERARPGGAREMTERAREVVPDTVEEFHRVAAEETHPRLIGALRGVPGVVDPGPKALETTVEKMSRKGYDTPARLTDVARGAAVLDSPEGVPGVLDALEEQFSEVLFEGFELRPGGYWDGKVLVRDDNGVVGEVQLLDRGMAAVKKEAYLIYDRMRESDLSREEFLALRQQSFDRYAPASAAARSEWAEVVDFGGGELPEALSIREKLRSSSTLASPSANSTPGGTDTQAPSLSSNPSNAPSASRITAGLDPTARNMSDSSISDSSSTGNPIVPDTPDARIERGRELLANPPSEVEPFPTRVAAKAGEGEPLTGRAVVDRKVQLEVNGAKPRSVDVGREFDRWHHERHGRVLDPANNPDDYEAVVAEMSHEAADQLLQPVTGVGWYEADITDTFDLLGTAMRPLVESEPLRVLWTAMATPTSFGVAAKDNAYMAARLMDAYLTGGRSVVPLKQPSGKHWGRQTVEGAMRLTNHLLERTGGEEQFARFMLSRHTVRELREIKQAAGFSTGGITGKADDLTYGAFLYGPKGGPFMLGLNGQSDDVVVDMWMSRWFNRHTGQMTRGSVDAKSGLVDTPRNESERALVKRLVTDVATRRGLSKSDAQAVIWYYEQRVHRQMGINVKASGFSDGARRFARERTNR